MFKILPLYVAGLFLAYLSHRASLYNQKLGRYEYKEHLFYTFIVISAVLFSGLRTRYNDTGAYINAYENLDVSTGWLTRIDWSLGEYPLFNLTNSVLKILGFSTQSFLMLYSAVTIGIYLWFIRKYTSNILLSVFLFFFTGCYGFSLAAIKQCVACAFCLVGVDRLIRNKTILFFIWTTVGVLFHPFSALFYVCPFLLFSPWTPMFILMIILFGILGFSMQTWLGKAVDLMSIVGVEYELDMLQNESVNIYRVLVVWAPIILSFLTAKFWQTKTNKAENLIMNLSTLCAELMFVALFGNPIYFGRLSNYFLIFQTISLPLILSFFENNSRSLLNAVVLVGYTGYTVYGNVLHGRTFDDGFTKITLWTYIKELF